MRVVVTGGGTGGHIMPALAVAEAVKRREPEAELLYIGGVSGMEAEIVPKYGVPFQAVTSRKFFRTFRLSMIGGVFALFQGYREARTYIRAFRAEAVIGTGGYAAAATVLAGAHLGVPTLIHEGNFLVGRTNRLLARWARRVCTTFAETVAEFPPGRAVQTGLPLREGIVLPPQVTPQAARAQFAGLEPERFTVLVIGGSQGARAVNDLVIEAAPQLQEARIQILHQVGARNVEEAQQKAAALNLTGRGGYCPLAFLDEQLMPLAYRAADVIVCRGGISTLAESLVNSLPLLIIPLPTAYADHQTYNAKALESGGAALHRAQKDLTAEILAQDLLDLRGSLEHCQQMSEAARRLSRPNAASDVVNHVLSLIRKNEV